MSNKIITPGYLLIAVITFSAAFLLVDKINEKKEIFKLDEIQRFTQITGSNDCNSEPEFNHSVDFFVKCEKYTDALKLIDRQILLNPQDEDLYIRKSYVYFKIENFEGLVDSATKAIELNSRDAMAYNNRAYGYLRLGKLTLAEEDLNNALKIDPNHNLALNNRGLLKIKRKQYESALEDVLKSKKIDDEIPEIYLNLGLIEFGKKRFHNALKQFDMAIKKNPKLAIAFVERAKTYKELGLNIKAENDERKAKELREKIKLNVE